MVDTDLVPAPRDNARRQNIGVDACRTNTLLSTAGRCRKRLAKLLAVSCLAPDIIIAIVEGRQPTGLTARSLPAADLPLAWGDQRRMLAIT
jgi:hypothetical protein